MSRSNPTERLINPAKLFFTWSDGKFNYYDRDKKQSVKCSLPFSFMVLDELTTIKGYNSKEKAGYYSNEVRDIEKEVLTVKLNKERITSGLYKEFIDTKLGKDMRYAKSIYIAYKIGNELEICNLTLTGAALGEWFDFKKKNDVYSGAVKVDDYVKRTQGTTEFTVPIFKLIEASDVSNNKAKALDLDLQLYLEKYLKKTESLSKETPTDNANMTEEHLNSERVYPDGAAGPDNDDLPF